MSEEVFLNGINGSTGLPLDDFQLTTELIAKVARKERLTKADLRDARIRNAIDKRSTDSFGVAQGIEIADLAHAGWGVIFPANLTEAEQAGRKDALKLLLDLRKKQVGDKSPSFYREFIGLELGYHAGETKDDFLRRNGSGTGAADPARGVPFYLLIAGSPEEIPFVFQYLLDVQYGVGRIHFDQLEDYAMYAQSVVAAENGQTNRTRTAAFFGVSHDSPTRLSSNYLIKPLFERITAKHANWDVSLVEPARATKSNLSDLLGGTKTPAILFSASHGMEFDLDDTRLMPHTGALVCQDYEKHTGGRVPEDFYFSANDIPSDANVSGTFAFFFACFGAGSPRTDNFYRNAFGPEKVIAPYAFISRLPLKLLSHPNGGALGVFAHVDRAWGCSFRWDGLVDDVGTFRSMLSDLLVGKPAGAASDFFGGRYGEIATMLTEELNETTPENQDDVKLAGSWTSHLDARNYTVIGDPAVRLPVAR